MFTCNEAQVTVNVDLLQEEYLGKVTGLRPFTKYNCSVHVRNTVGVSESTEVQIFTTDQDGESRANFIHARSRIMNCNF